MRWGVALKGLATVLKLVTTIFLTRTLTLENFGLYNLIVNLRGIFGFVIGAGLLYSTSRFIPELFELNDKRRAMRLAIGMTVLRAFVSGAMCGLLYWQFPAVSRFLNIPNSVEEHSILVLLVLWLPRVVDIFGPYFRNAILDFRTIAIHDALMPFLFCGGVLILSWLGADVKGLLVLMLFADAASAAFYAALFGRTYLHIRRDEPTHDARLPRPLIRRVAAYSLSTTFYGFGALGLGTNIDTLIVARMFGVPEVALYTFAYGVVVAVYSLNPTIFLKNLFINLLTRRYAKTRSLDDLRRGAELTWRCGVSFAVPSLLYLYLLAPPLISHIYNPALVPAAELFPIFIIMAIFRNALPGLFAIISNLELSRYLGIINVIGAINVALAIVLGERYGLGGVACATCLSECGWCIYLVWVARARGNVPVRLHGPGMIRILCNALVGSSPAFLLGPAIGGAVSALGVLGACMAVYGITSLLNNPFTPGERHLIMGVIRPATKGAEEGLSS